MKVVINSSYGGFGLSDIAFEKYLERKGIKYSLSDESTILGNNIYVDEDGDYLLSYDIERNDPILVEVVEELGEKSNDRFSELKIVEIPDDIDYVIEEYDGNEWISEKHKTWR